MILDEEIKTMKDQYCDIIRRRLGIVLHTHQINDLIKIIHEACIKFDCTPEKYLKLLNDCPDKDPLLDHLISGITINETYFFRDKQQMELLQYEILPEIIRTKKEEMNLSLRIWSAGCSSGEEIYTVAMLLFELLPDINQWNIRLLATDINTKTLHKAIKGLYSEWSMRSISDYYKQKYFKKNNTQYQLSKNVMDLVNFDYLNLNYDNYPSIFNGTNSQDLILCRNVLIYFDNDQTIQLINRFKNSLNFGGYLLFGASDPMNMMNLKNIFQHRKGALFVHQPDGPIEARSKKIILHVQPDYQSKPTKIKKVRLSSPLKKSPTVSHSEKAMEFANQGQLNEALKVCEDGFQSNPMDKMNYFTYGLILVELNKLEEAEIYFRKSLFLDNQFVLGHFQLGLLLIRKNQVKSGTKYLENALKIVESQKPEDAVSGHLGLSYQKLSEILRQEMKLYI